MLFGRQLQRFEFAVGTGIGQRRTVSLGGVDGGIEREVKDTARCLNRCEQTRMYFTKHGRAQSMRGKPRALSNRDVRQRRKAIETVVRQGGNETYVPDETDGRRCLPAIF